MKRRGEREGGAMKAIIGLLCLVFLLWGYSSPETPEQPKAKARIDFEITQLPFYNLGSSDILMGNWVR